MNHIELFAGCGGLSLGLQAAGFNLILANELSPMAAETFAFNFFNENFQQLALVGELPKRSHWLTSNFSDLKSRLRENPYEFPTIQDQSINGLDLNTQTKLEGGLIIGNIVELNKALWKHPNFKSDLRTGFGKGQIDLVSGGPPCQSFSMAGLRDRECNRNTLPMEMAKFVSHVQPKTVLLENVTGILRPFTDPNGNKYYAWFEVAKLFAIKGYVPLCFHVNARHIGIAQNRPRFIMIAVRHDCYLKLKLSFPQKSIESEMLTRSKRFYDIVQTEGEDAQYGNLDCYDPTVLNNAKYFKNSIFEVFFNRNPETVRAAIDDLKFNSQTAASQYVLRLNKTFAPFLKRETTKPVANHELRANTLIVRSRFRIYQILELLADKCIEKEIKLFLKGQTPAISLTSWRALQTHRFLGENGELKYFSDLYEFEAYLSKHLTRKITQNALKSEQPAPTALSVPDDTCHYDENELRVLTVRETARIQSFPDNFEFRSKVTTGGTSRRFEVPQYTQVGNAVPPLMGLAAGEICKEIIQRINKQ